MIRTVLGDIPPAALGVCDAHDHVLIAGGLGVVKNPDLAIGDVDVAVDELAAFHDSGGRAMVDCMPLDCGRDAVGLVTVSERTGVHVIAATGFHTPHYYPADHWTYAYDVDTIVGLLVAEVDEGMDSGGYGGPRVERLSARAGVVKVASEHGRIAPVTRKLFEAAAACHVETGVPVLTHAEQGTMALEQLALLLEHGVAPSAVLVSHVDRNHDHGVHAELAATGAYLVYDGLSRTKYHRPDEVAALIEIAIAAGAADHVLLGLDLALRSYRTGYGGAPGFGFLLECFVPLLRARGVGDDAIDAVLIDNPARALDMRVPTTHEERP